MGRIKRTKSLILALLLCLSLLTDVYALNSQMVDNEESIEMNLQEDGLGKIEPVSQPTVRDDFYVLTIGSFSLLIIVLIYGGYAYKTAIKGQKVSLFGTHKKQKIKNYVQ